MNDLEATLYAKGYRLINGEWTAPSRLAQPPINKPDPGNEPVGEGPRKIADPVRRFVRIKSYRCRLVDRDAVWVKYIIDALRYAGILFDDTEEWLEYEVSQEKVEDPRQQRTEVTIL